METKCAEIVVSATGQIREVLREISCNGYPNWIIWTVIAVGGLIVWSLFLHPYWNVWASRKSGLAELAEAENAEKVAIAQANARIGAAKANKEAEVMEAQAVSESIAKIGNALQTNPSYNVWQWIKMMEKGNNATIYVPTESNLPILEAMRLGKNVPENVDEESA